MSRELMISQLIKWNPCWNIKTINSWKTPQLFAIYMKELEKNKTKGFQQNTYNNCKQVSFF